MYDTTIIIRIYYRGLNNENRALGVYDTIII